MRNIILCLLLLTGFSVQAQELYIMTDPASNVPANSIGVRVSNKLMPRPYDNNRYGYRVLPEVMFGISKSFMLRGTAYASNMFQKGMQFEGGNVYAKYRFLSIDDLHSHFRMAAFGKVSVSNNPLTMQHTRQHIINGEPHSLTNVYRSNEIDLDGNHSGFNAGVIATQLVHKLAVSGTIFYTSRWDNIDAPKVPGISRHAANYSLSAGYLLLPRVYKDYRQPNFNIYVDLLGASALDGKGYYLDVVPGIQFIFNSISRLDLAYRVQAAGNMERFNTSSWLLRYEYNFLNALMKKEK